MAGLRLVAAILLSRLILGTSAVQTPVQVGRLGKQSKQPIWER